MEKKSNRLINEKSPYLLQHAYNPIDWYPWCEEAFQRAHNENKLILISIGYSTCHWCHQMAHDSFSDKDIADYLNSNFISIKVDREERPDIDEVYMFACQLLSDNCGWPLNIITTPDKKPIFAATYLPPIESYGRRSFLSILKEINDMWSHRQDKVLEIADNVFSQIETVQILPEKENIDERTLRKAFDIYEKNFDEIYGGFGGAPKFPTPHNLSFLLECHKRENEPYALKMVEKTLLSMYKGGIFDHIGGGFHRYSTDKTWLVPHFEKMLYDQALISIAYIETYEVTKKEVYADAAKRTLDFVLRDMVSLYGPFYAGIDADTEGEEGKFYVWTKDEIFRILDDEDAELFCAFYGILLRGNLENGKNVLIVSSLVDDLAKKYNLNADEIKSKLGSARQRLNDVRNQRVHPHVDDKILASWNGLTIKALAYAAKVFDEERYKHAAIKAADFILENLVTPEGDVFRSFIHERSNILGFIEDYSFLIYGLLELYKVTDDPKYLEQSQKIASKMISEFYDEAGCGFFLSSVNADTPLVRMKNALDHAIPSGNSVAVLDLLLLKKLTNNSEYDRYINETFSCFGLGVNQYPTSYAQLLLAFMYFLK